MPEFSGIKITGDSLVKQNAVAILLFNDCLEMCAMLFCFAVVEVKLSCLFTFHCIYRLIISRYHTDLFLLIVYLSIQSSQRAMCC